MKFKPGDRVRYVGSSPYSVFKTTATVVGYSGGYLEVRHDGYDYRLKSSPDNCHNSYTEEEYELEAILDSPLYKALL